MEAKSKAEFIAYFMEIDDPREDDRLLYPLHEILFLVFVAIICAAESWDGMLMLGEQNIDFLKEYFAYENGLPSKASISRIFSLVDKKCIEAWLEKMTRLMIGGFIEHEQIAIDGKALRGKQRMEQNSQGTHVVNVFATKLGVTLTQKTVEGKGHELMAITEILEDLNVENATVSIDAVGCQKESEISQI